MSESIAIESTPEVLELPFVHVADNGEVCLWRPNPTGHRDVDIMTGEHFARLTMVVAREFGVPMLLASVLRDMMLVGRFTGVEAGFIASVACAAQVGSMN